MSSYGYICPRCEIIYDPHDFLTACPACYVETGGRFYPLHGIDLRPDSGITLRVVEALLRPIGSIVDEAERILRRA